jgi:hypothetical protein
MKYPRNLKKAGRRFYRTVLSEFVFEDCHDLERLAQAAACLDEIALAEEIIEKDGRYFKTQAGVIRPHPGLATIRDFRTLFIRITRELSLDTEAIEAPRPPKI